MNWRSIPPALLLVAALGGCSTLNSTYSNLQLNGDALPFPANYQEATLKAVASHTGEGAVSISYPEQIAGNGVFDKRRWFVCVHGLTPHGETPPRTTTAFAIENLSDPPAATGVFEAILIFSQMGPGAPLYTFDAPLCRHANFAPA